MNKRFSLILILTALASIASASKARIAALGGNHVPQESTLALSIERGDDKNFNQLVKQKQSKSDLELALTRALVGDQTKYLEILISEKKNEITDLIKNDPQFFQTALIEAGLKTVQILEKHTEVAKLKYENGNSVLFEAVSSSDISVINYLVKKYPALITQINDAGESILFASVRRGDRNIVDQVLKIKNLPKERTNKKGETAQSIALSMGFKRIAEKVK